MKSTGERLNPEEIETMDDYLLYLRHLFAYHITKNFVKNTDLVLEVGCGEGYGTFYLSKNVKKIIALDTDKSIIEKAKEKYNSKNIEFREYNGENIPYEDNLFDVVISFQVIEHIRDDRKFVKEIHRVLKKGGKYILTTPNRKLRLKNGERPWNRFHIREYSVEMLEKLLSPFFNSITLYGVDTITEIKKRELKRVEKNRKLAKVDILNLRYLLPENLSIKLSNFLKNKEGKDANKKFSLSDYFLTKNPENGLDLYGICKK